MTDKKALWKRVCVTDPKAVKAITGKQYQGNSPKPYWIVERLTEEFGPCGLGWGFSIVNERMERLTESEILHVAVVRFWYELDGKRGEVEQIGQTKAVYAKRDGSLLVDEDAPKKSVTDALVKCASYIGFAGDIFAGRWDDSKYVESARKHYEEESGITRGRKNEILELADKSIELFAEGKELAAYEQIVGIEDNEEKMFLWSYLKPHSALRASIKRFVRADLEKQYSKEKETA